MELVLQEACLAPVAEELQVQEPEDQSVAAEAGAAARAPGLEPHCFVVSYSDL